MIPQEIIRRKRDGETLTNAEIADFIAGLTDNRVTEGQAAAFAMAVWYKGMSPEEIVALTLAMRDSGTVMVWPGIGGPVGDKHSTGGVGDNVSLMLAPIVAVFGLKVPMISGRGLGHTGGTLDKLQSIPGYDVYPSPEKFRRVVAEVGCAIIGQTGDLAPADRRLYAIRDVTATVESVPLITASILSKKLAAGLQTLLMDVKVGNGAFMQTMEGAETLARSLVRVAGGAGVPTTALITDMNEPLADAAGNAVEVANCMEFLEGRKGGTRLETIVLEFGAFMLANAGLAGDVDAGRSMAQQALADGRALEKFGDMVKALGGPSDFARNWKSHLPKAKVIVPVEAEVDGYIAAMDARAIGMAVIGLGGGRTRPQDDIDHSVGFSGIQPVGTKVAKGGVIAHVHATDATQAEAARRDYLAAIHIGGERPADRPVILKIIS
jgi:thymidine phosphorylase